MSAKLGRGVYAFIVPSLFVFGLLLSTSPKMYFTGKVVDATSGNPVSGALVTIDDRVIKTDKDGLFKINWSGEKIAVRAYGYQRKSVDINPKPRKDISLSPVTPRALYLSVYGIGEPILRDPVIELIEETVLNAVVIDVKGDRGIIPYKTSITMAQEIEANKPLLVKDLPGLVAEMREKGIYTIARIVVFKDDVLAQARPDLALKNGDGEIWRDREGLAWTEPYNKAAWDYNIAVAVEAAIMGFDEIQFDYLRFPDEPGPRYTIPYNETNRVASIVGFLEQAREALLPYNVFVSADLFGYVLWNKNDTYIGQRLEDLVPLLDYISPMLYPSSFQYGIPDHSFPVAYPYEIVYYTLRNAGQRTEIPAVRFRPWLQAFRDYAFDRRHFNSSEIRSQIKAAETFGSNGWMLWNPRNVYSPDVFIEESEE